MNARIANLMSSLNVTQKGAERVAAIVDTGAQILLDEGFASLTKRRIAKRLGISHGNVGYYFPTRESLWNAVVEYELEEYYRRHQSDDCGADPQAALDAFVDRWIDEYNDRRVRLFFSHVIAFAESNAAVARIRDRVYESFFAATLARIEALHVQADDEELEQRALEVMMVLEGLHAVSAFRPSVIVANDGFRQRLRRRVNAIVRGD